MVMNIVVTGALGHIGSQLIREIPFTFPGANIWLVDNLSTQRYCSLFNLPTNGRYHFVEADVLTADLAQIFDGAEVVIHLAAITNATDSFENKEQVERVNYTGTEKVARACLQAGSALIFISTTSVYGTQTGPVDESCPITSLRPQSPYAESKLKAEQLLETLGQVAGLRFVICRFGTVFGASVGMRFHTAINKFCWQAVTRQPITVWRTALHQQRPYLDLTDAVEALKFILQRNLFDRRVYNIVTLNTSVSQIVETVTVYVPDVSVEYVNSPVMNQLSYRVMCNRIKSLGFEFKGDLKRGIGETIQLFKALTKSRMAGAIVNE
jgi:UDP-glucose 4-epimerase